MQTQAEVHNSQSHGEWQNLWKELEERGEEEEEKKKIALRCFRQEIDGQQK